MRNHTLLFFLLASFSAFSQDAATDSIVKAALESQSLTGEKEQGLNLIQQDKWSEAGKYFNEEIKKNEGDRQAYFGRGVVQWAQNDPAGACRDWSAVLALGDTATFKLLDKNCHGNMVVDKDTIPTRQYRKMIAKKDPAAMAPPPGEPEVFVEEMPYFAGGQEAMFGFLQKNIKYPAAAKNKRTQGRVYISFIVSSQGKILYPHVTRGVGDGLDEEALHVIRIMPAWSPGKQNGKPVPVRMSLPINFQLR